MSLYSSNRSSSERNKDAEDASVYLVSVLKEHGPLSIEVLKYFTLQLIYKSEEQSMISPRDFGYFCNYAENAGLIVANNNDKFAYCLPEDVDSGLRLPQPLDFTSAYYKLLARYEVVKEVSEVNVPESIISEIMGEQLYPDDKATASTAKTSQTILKAKENDE